MPEFDFVGRRQRLAKETFDGDALAFIPSMTLYYLTGVNWMLTERPLIWLWRPSGESAWVTAELERPHVEQSFGAPASFYCYNDATAPLDAIRRLVTEQKLRGLRVLVDPGVMRVFEAQLLTEAGLTVAPGAERVVAGLRARKDATELAWYRRAVIMAETALEKGLGAMRVGVPESEVARVLTLETIALGSGPFWKQISVISGPHAAAAHTRTSDRRLERGDTVVVDVGAVVGGYVSDITRTFFVQEASAEWRRRYHAVLRANQAAVAAARPGAALGDLDTAARRVLEAEGLGRYFVHRVGHGVGLEGHEAPYLWINSKEPLLAGHLFTIEPGVYIPGEGGVRIEDDVFFDGTSGQTLSTFDTAIRLVG